MKQIKIILLAILLSLSLTGCSKNKEEKIEIIDDNYRNVYEIFVASFKDSDGDRIGDLNGVTEELDYIQDMGYTAIWFMPIHPSPSYHKYDVTDYYDIDSSFGTLEDFDKLITEAHKRDIHIILDLVVNHTSSSHPWFVDAKKAYLSGQHSDYVDWYNFSTSAKSGFTKISEGKYYEARFVDSMPDLNLDNEEVRNEIRNIMQFWIERGVDGFRLDATTSYYTGDNAANTEFLKWINDTAKELKEDCYIVGEAWTDDNTITGYYDSGVDSFFHFSMSQSEGTIVKTLKVSAPSSNFKNALQKALSITKGHIPAIFLDNHDVNRIAGGIGRSQRERIKFAYGLAGMFNGCVYTYYGTEIGMVGSGKDENKRIAMLWDSEDESTLCKNPSGATSADYVYEGVKQQQADADSILNYHKAINRLRNKYPQIARGEMNFLTAQTSQYVLSVEKSWEDTTILIVINFNEEESESVDLSELEYKSMECVSAYNEEATFKDGELILPAYTIAVLSK